MQLGDHIHHCKPSASTDGAEAALEVSRLCIVNSLDRVKRILGLRRLRHHDGGGRHSPADERRLVEFGVLRGPLTAFGEDDVLAAATRNKHALDGHCARREVLACFLLDHSA